MARKDRDVKQEEAEQNQQQEEMLQRQERKDPQKVGGEPIAPAGEPDLSTPRHTGTSSEAQTSPHKLPDSLGTSVAGTPDGRDRRGVVSRQLGTRPPYTGPERRKS